MGTPTDFKTTYAMLEPEVIIIQISAPALFLFIIRGTLQFIYL